ncbi:sensor histidine kinase [Euzebya tangerina]|uniref:sensor histidine kinase n=1 Tax=Euzebya tangerina TaxID=591198 RepID=UPI000E31E11E|nr:ATP-binding protein [Euzebya tangerina]
MSTTSDARRVYLPDEPLLRRFGIVRAVGSAAYIIAVIILARIYGQDAWPLVIGVPVLVVVTLMYFIRSRQFPRSAVALSLLADTIVLGGASAFVGGTGSGTAALYVIPIVSAGIILGPFAAGASTALAVALAWLQLLSEEMGLEPTILFRPDMGDRLVVLLIMTSVLISVGYLSGTYASRLHLHIAAADVEAEAVRQRTRRRRSFVRQASVDVREPLKAVEEVAAQLDDDGPLNDETRRQLASQLRMRSAELEGEVEQLIDVGQLDEARDAKPEPVLLSRVIEDCLADLGPRLAAYVVEVDVPPIRVSGDRRMARRVAYNLLENVVDHTPPGTRVWIEGRQTGGQGVLIVTDDGPGIPPKVARKLFESSDVRAVRAGTRRVGLPLVRELVDAMGAEMTYTARGEGGSIILVGFRLAPRDAPSSDGPHPDRGADGERQPEGAVTPVEP